MSALFAVFLLAHAMIHTGWVTPRPEDPKYPFDITRSRLFPALPARVLKIVAYVDVAVIVIAYGIAAAGLLGVPGLSEVWGIAAIVGSAFSLEMCVLFWHPWFVMGPVLDIAIIAAVVTGWPTSI